MQPSSLPGLIPASLLPAIEKALRQTFQTTEITDLLLLRGGLSGSAVYKLVMPDRSYVLKTEPPAGSPVDVTDAMHCMQIAADAGIAPPIYYHSKEDGLSIVGFVEGKPVNAVYASPDVLAQKLGAVIRNLHDMPRFQKEGSLLDTIDQLMTFFRRFPLLKNEVKEEAAGYYATIREHYPWNDPDKVSSHNDLNPTNILCDGEKIWIIDWDTAFVNDRYVDIAAVANFYLAGGQHEKSFLKAYFGREPTAYQEARFFIMRQLGRLIYAMLMFQLAEKSRPAGAAPDTELGTTTVADIGKLFATGKIDLSTFEGQFAFGKALLYDALVHMRGAKFTASLEQL